jgi:hypothetical protein
MANTSHASSITDRFVAQPCEFPTVKITLLQVREMKNCHPTGFVELMEMEIQSLRKIKAGILTKARLYKEICQMMGNYVVYLPVI